MKILLMLLLAVFAFLPYRAEAASQNLTIDGDHGKLSAVLQTPDNKTSYPLVMILHGFTGNKNETILNGIADKLEQNGIASIRFDFNGHGDSEGRFEDMTVPNEIEDAKKVYEYVRNLSGVTSIAMAGHSQGGVVTSMTAGQLGKDKIKCIVLMAPAAVLREDAIRGSIMGKQYDSLNPPATIEIYNGLKLGRNYVLTARDLPIYETAAGFTGSACIIHGTGDTVVPYTYGERYTHLYPNSEYHLLDNLDHVFSQNQQLVIDIASDYLIRELNK